MGGFPWTLIAYWMAAWIGTAKPLALYGSNEEAKFWQGVRSNPSASTRDIRSRFRDIDRLNLGFMDPRKGLRPILIFPDSGQDNKKWNGFSQLTSLLIREAGGYATDFEGSNGMFETGSIVAGNEYIHKALREVLHRPVPTR